MVSVLGVVTVFGVFACNGKGLGGIENGAKVETAISVKNKQLLILGDKIFTNSKYTEKVK
jgi:hypothetical protein